MSRSGWTLVCVAALTAPGCGRSAGIGVGAPRDAAAERAPSTPSAEPDAAPSVDAGGEIEGAVDGGAAEGAADGGEAEAAAEMAFDGGAVDGARDGGGEGGPWLRIAGGPPITIYCDLVVEGEGLDEFEGRAVDVQNQVSTYHRRAWGRTTIKDGKFSITFPQSSEMNAYYGSPVQAVIDVDGNGRCGGTDRGAVQNLWACVDGRVTIHFDAAAFAGNAACDLMSDRCARWSPTQSRFLDLYLVASGLTEADGRSVRVAAREAGTLALTGLASARVLKASFAAYIPRGRPRSTPLEIFWFADADGDGACGSADHGGVAAVPATDGTETERIELTGATGASSASGSPAFCSGFPPRGTLELRGTGFEADEGTYLTTNLRVASGGALLAAEGVAMVMGGVARFAQGPIYEPGAQVELFWSSAGRGSAGHFLAGPLTRDGDGIFRATFVKANSGTATGAEGITALMNGCL